MFILLAPLCNTSSANGRPRVKRRISFSLSISPLLPKTRSLFSIGSFSSDDEGEGGSKYRMPAVASVYHFSLSSAPLIPRTKCSLKMWLAENPGNKIDRTIKAWCILVWLLEYTKRNCNSIYYYAITFKCLHFSYYNINLSFSNLYFLAISKNTNRLTPQCKMFVLSIKFLGFIVWPVPNCVSILTDSRLWLSASVCHELIQCASSMSIPPSCCQSLQHTCNILTFKSKQPP